MLATKKNSIDWIKTLLLVDGDNMRAALQSHEDSLERAAMNAGIPVVRIKDYTSGVTCTHYTEHPVNTDVLSLRVRKADIQMKGVGEQTSSVPTEDMSSSVSGSSDEDSEMSLSIKTVEHASEVKVVAKPSMSQMKKNSIDWIKTLLLVDGDNMRAALQSHEDSLERAAMNAGIPVVRIKDYTSGVTCSHFTEHPVNTHVLSLRVRKADKQMKGVGEQREAMKDKYVMLCALLLLLYIIILCTHIATSTVTGQ